jgi:formylglycine-generating enzyme required for sulfatase activity
MELAHPNGVMYVGVNAEIRLPTEWEWQWAAQGGNANNQYPWGSDPREGYANTRVAGLSRSTSVGMYPHGAAKCGALDMVGNLSEWCLNQLTADPKQDDWGGYKIMMVNRGGSFQNSASLS